MRSARELVNLKVRRIVNPSEGLKLHPAVGHIAAVGVRRIVNPSEGLKL